VLPVSQPQRKLFRWAAANPAAAEERGIKPSVAKEFNAADPGGKLPARKTGDRMKAVHERTKKG
jgi:hypothetical protein